MDSVIEVRDVSHRFGSSGSSYPVVDHVSLTVGKNEFVSLVGPSGCGKTTLLNLVAGLEPLQSGTVSVFGDRPRAGQNGVSYAFARDALLPWRTAEQNVCLPMQLAGVPLSDQRLRAGELLKQVGLEENAGSYRSQLSQGMRQRVALARALANRPSLLLMDEPFAALDAQTRISMQQELLRMLAHENVTVLFVTHDLGEAITLSDRVVLLTRRPAAIRSVFEIDLPRPRNPIELQSNDRYHKLVERVWAELANEFP
jgi:NitT/TauT family transport system ATP-binding protein